MTTISLNYSSPYYRFVESAISFKTDSLVHPSLFRHLFDHFAKPKKCQPPKFNNFPKPKM